MLFFNTWGNNARWVKYRKIRVKIATLGKCKDMFFKRNTKILPKFVGTVLVLGTLLIVPAVNAAIFNVAGVNNSSNSALIDFNYNAILGVVNIGITNNGTFGSDPRITGFAFNTPGNVTGTSAFSASGTEDNSDWAPEFGTISTPGTSGTFDLAGITGPNFNGGKANSGIAVNNTANFSFTLTGTNLGTLTEISFLSILTPAKDNNPDAAFAVRFQRTGDNGQDSDTALGIPAVPVPAAFWLFGTALIGFVGVSRRRNLA